MQNKLLLSYTVLLASASTALPAWAAEVQLSLELPRLNVAEYHRPYVAIWAERAGEPATSLAVWYDQKKANNAGAKWLPDMRQWWRKSGRDLSMPMDGVSGATRPVGEHKVDLSKSLGRLPAGKYELVVEVAREGGGREVQRLALQLPIASASQVSVQGEHELGALSLSVKP
ncbi:DUF2271 domain-containing protein [Roseateles oligotrophus]|uniref:DUF2271 domain-containing protein n=1 Tax=Roseateles oligotrophus TaxID=1769250 RepID=A0ABT2YGJ7_9BURK|nr:DUF2271 domain-containing protein [Roseateles oligotrophus]MCV2369171.1 DUF2271 domain-containing protein [Roseateles oligotrophus]